MTVHPRRPREALWTAALVHRLSGVALAVFLPVHLLVLGLALEGQGALDGFLRWTQYPLVKVAEGGLVFLLGVHLLGGLRILVIENLPWHDRQRQLAAGAALISVIAAAVLLVRVF